MLRTIQTRYAGYFFRSRLEARWAVFFTALGLKWEYEPEGFELPSGRYLPDFFVRIQDGPSRASPDWTTPVPGYWVAIKGAPPDVLELRKLVELTRGSNHRCILIWGLPDSREWWETFYDKPDAVQRTKRIPARDFFMNCVRPTTDAGNDYETAFYRFTLGLWATNCAKGARFEHGESGPKL